MGRSAQYYYDKGSKHAEQGEYELAVEAYSLAIEIDPSDPYPFSDRGVAYFHLEKKELALQDMDRAQELQPDLGYRYSSRAYIKASMGRLEEAIQDYHKAIEVDPDDAIAHNNLGLLQEEKGYRDKARSHFIRADQLSEDEKEEVKKYGRPIGTGGKEQSEAVSGTQQFSAEGVERPGWKDLLKVMRKVFTSGEMFRDFLRFIRRGFRS